ncbi:intraflagellar transport protein 46 homolog [Orussus abietinus]|uniref:intraflagellar transport protein 46 homolog n=1 Tax=Orussus abietinus TaxID=222816 RepID=UPI000625ED0F|nr:intraflagellar transport protein 46 homolog [Orussus abietinus]XP_023288528.1 intraflagellar transport protein 46 homolog [Orussus abietinus]
MYDVEDSSEEEDTQHISAFSKFDESIEVRNAEDIESPVISMFDNPGSRNRSKSPDESSREIGIDSSRRKSARSRYAERDDDRIEPFRKSMTLLDDPSDSEETDEDDIRGTNLARTIEYYDPKQFDDIQASAEVKELFQNITRYTPQKIELNFKLAPFIPDYIPAVGDIDAFLKVPRPDGKADKVGLTVLDEPCTDQSEPAVLYLLLRSRSKSAGLEKQSVIKRVENAEKNGKSVDKWIEDMNQLRGSKHAPSVQLTAPTPDIDALMQHWPFELEQKLTDMNLDLSKLDCDVSQLADIVCTLLDIPVHENKRLEALHVLFSLYLEVRDHR